MTEYVDYVDEDDNVIGKVTRKEADEKNLRIRVSRIFVFDNKNSFLIQKRASTKAECPNHLDFGVAETLQVGENYESGAVRGIKEELGITGISDSDIKFLFKLKYTEKTKRWYKVYSVVYNGQIRIDKHEVSEVKFVSEDVLNKLLETEKFHPGGLKVYKEYKRLKGEI